MDSSVTPEMVIGRLTGVIPTTALWRHVSELQVYLLQTNTCLTGAVLDIVAFHFATQQQKTDSDRLLAQFLTDEAFRKELLIFAMAARLGDDSLIRNLSQIHQS